MERAVPIARYKARLKSLVATEKEEELQASVFAWLGTVRLINAIVFHVPNGRKLDRQDAAIVNRLGVRKGVADLAIMREGGRQAWLELKRKGERQTPEQVDFSHECKRLGHPYAVATSLREVQSAFVEWGVLWESAGAPGRVMGGNFQSTCPTV